MFYDRHRIGVFSTLICYLGMVRRDQRFVFPAKPSPWTFSVIWCFSTRLHSDFWISSLIIWSQCASSLRTWSSSPCCTTLKCKFFLDDHRSIGAPTTLCFFSLSDVPWYADSEWNNVKGQLSTVDRHYGHVHSILHSIGTHQIHHLFTKVPHYHLGKSFFLLFESLSNIFFFSFGRRGDGTLSQSVSRVRSLQRRARPVRISSYV